MDLVFEAPKRGRPPRHLADLTAAERKTWATELGIPSMRANQIARHWFQRLVDDPDAMTDLPIEGRHDLVRQLVPPLLTDARTLSCDEGTTSKTLWRLHDGSLVESVLMGYPERVTVCISSQAGCGMACPFCATGQGGLTRNLSAAEIVAQVQAAARVTAAGVLGDSVPSRLSNVVFMGMGEPLANYSRLMTALRVLTGDLGLSARSITVSTVGLAPSIIKLAGEGIPVTLAVSLHAPDDELRDTLVPVNNRWNVRETLGAAWDYAAATGRRVSIEYALIRDVNDQVERAKLLAQLLRGRLVHVNLIPLNPTPGSEWDASPKPQERAFVKVLRDSGISTTVRDTRGREIAGACGQLAASEA
jgi:23S rRNA (adenine2503-C2)-methyltransferase